MVPGMAAGPLAGAEPLCRLLGGGPPSSSQRGPHRGDLIEAARLVPSLLGGLPMAGGLPSGLRTPRHRKGRTG